jgi:hypothetical protein
VAEGFVYWSHQESGAFRMGDCSNPFGELLLLAKETKPAPAPIVIPPTVVEEKKVIEITEVIKKDIILEESVTCVQGDTRTAGAINNGKAVCPTLTIVAPIIVDEPIRVRPHVVQTPSTVRPAPAAITPQKKAEACVGENCHLEAHVTRTEPRTDGKCVLPMRDTNTGKVHVVWLGTVNRQGMNLLVATRTNDGRLEGSSSGHVGDDRQTVRMQSKDCFIARDAFLSQRNFASTAQRIGLPLSCVPVVEQDKRYMAPRPQV